MPARTSSHTPPRPHAPYHFPADPGIPLSCPACKALLARDEQRFVCRGGACRRAYPIRDAIPVLLESESVVLADAEWRTIPGL